MDWKALLILTVCIVAFLIWKRMSLAPARLACELRARGALIVDVRSAGEFRSMHLQGAVNVPLDELETKLPAVAKDKSQPLLVHCLSGTRSGLAIGRIKSLGYEKVYNVGSYQRARALFGERR